MNPEPKNFDRLRRLLLLKRHEQPPPGYFNRFSRDVMARIKAGDAGEKLGLEPAWYRRLLGMFEVKPVFAGAFGMAVCTLVVSGVISSEPGSSVAATDAPESSRANFVVDSVSAGSTTARDILFTPAETNTMVSLFDIYKPPIQAERAAASYWRPGGN